MANMRIQQKSYTATKNADSSVHHLHCSMSLFLTPYRPLTALNPCLRADWPAVCLELELSDSTPESHSSLTTSFVLSSSLAGSHRHSSLCGLCTKIDKWRSRHFGTASKILTIILPVTHNTQRPTLTHPSIHPSSPLFDSLPPLRLPHTIPSHYHVSIQFFYPKWSEKVLLLFSCFWKPQKCVTGLK